MTRDVLERTNQIMSERIVKINSHSIFFAAFGGKWFRAGARGERGGWVWLFGMPHARFVSLGLFPGCCFLLVFCSARLSQSPVAGWLISASARRMAGKIPIQTVR